MDKKILFYLTLMLAALMPEALCAQQPSDPGRQQWLQEMRQYKRQYFTKELGLSRDQQNKFFPLFEELNEQTFRIGEEARQMERRVAEMKDPSDTELEKATEALYDADLQTARLEKEYLDKFKNILTRRQLFMLKSTERKFQRDMMRQHQHLRKGKAPRPQGGAATPKARRK